MLILAYSDSCPHCRNFKPIWNQFKNKYQNVIDIREVDTQNPKEAKIAQELGVRSIPKIYLLNNGKKHVFEGERNLANLEKFVKQHLNSHINDKLTAYREI